MVGSSDIIEALLALDGAIGGGSGPVSLDDAYQNGRVINIVDSSGSTEPVVLARSAVEDSAPSIKIEGGLAFSSAIGGTGPEASAFIVRGQYDHGTHDFARLSFYHTKLGLDEPGYESQTAMALESSDEAADMVTKLRLGQQSTTYINRYAEIVGGTTSGSPYGWRVYGEDVAGSYISGMRSFRDLILSSETSDVSVLAPSGGVLVEGDGDVSVNSSTGDVAVTAVGQIKLTSGNQSTWSTGGIAVDSSSAPISISSDSQYIFVETQGSGYIALESAQNLMLTAGDSLNFSAGALSAWTLHGLNLSSGMLPVNITSAAQDIALQTVTSGDLSVTAAEAINLTAGTPSTWATKGVSWTSDTAPLTIASDGQDLGISTLNGGDISVWSDGDATVRAGQILNLWSASNTVLDSSGTTEMRAASDITIRSVTGNALLRALRRVDIQAGQPSTWVTRGVDLSSSGGNRITISNDAENISLITTNAGTISFESDDILYLGGSTAINMATNSGLSTWNLADLNLNAAAISASAAGVSWDVDTFDINASSASELQFDDELTVNSDVRLDLTYSSGTGFHAGPIVLGAGTINGTSVVADRSFFVGGYSQADDRGTEWVMQGFPTPLVMGSILSKLSLFGSDAEDKSSGVERMLSSFGGHQATAYVIGKDLASDPPDPYTTYKDNTVKAKLRATLDLDIKDITATTGFNIDYTSQSMLGSGGEFNRFSYDFETPLEAGDNPPTISVTVESSDAEIYIAKAWATGLTGFTVHIMWWSGGAWVQPTTGTGTLIFHVQVV